MTLTRLRRPYSLRCLILPPTWTLGAYGRVLYLVLVIDNGSL